MTRRTRFGARLLVLALLLAGPAGAESGDGDPGLPEEAIPLATLPERPRPLLELGEQFLAPVEISEGWRLPTGAVWQPSALLWGTLRTALQGDWGRALDQAQWASRLDLFGQVSLTPTERIVASIEPFQDGTRFTGYRFGLDGASAEFVSDIDFRVETLFFEGDLGEIFPRVDRDTWWPLDLGFMVGRVPVVFQDGFLIDDRMTGIGLVQNSLQVPGTSNLRVSFLGAWSGLHRGDNSPGGHTRLFGVFSEFDRSETTWAIDLAYADGDGGSDGLFFGASAIRRVRGRLNLTLRALGSWDFGPESGAVDKGLLGVVGLSFAPRGTHDLAYLNVVGAAGHYTAAAREADRGGPLGRVGILFEAFGVGAIGAPLANDGRRVLGGALGYHKFLAGGRTQLVLELGGRADYADKQRAAVAGGLRFQQALGRHVILRIDGWVGHERISDAYGGARTELVFKF